MASFIAVSTGKIGYRSAWQIQKDLHRRVAGGELPGVLLLLEHPHVYTLGRRGRISDILATPDKLSRLGVEVQQVDRGGEVTYHGPGQLIGYPIVNLRRWGGGPLRYVRALEEIIVAALGEFGLQSNTGEKPTGVWVEESKIAAIGVKVSRGVTTHGFALNVNPDLSYFDHIVPCGMPEGRVTSLERERPGVANVSSIIPVVARHFGEVFGWKVEWSGLPDLLGANVTSPPAPPDWNRPTIRGVVVSERLP